MRCKTLRNKKKKKKSLKKHQFIVLNSMNININLLADDKLFYFIEFVLSGVLRKENYHDSIGFKFIFCSFTRPILFFFFLDFVFVR